MIPRIAVSLLLIAMLCTPVAPQGGCSRNIAWGLSGASNIGGQSVPPASPQWLAQLQQLEAQYGGTPPECTYTWFSPQQDGTRTGHWLGVCLSYYYSCPNPPAPPPNAPPEAGARCPAAGRPVCLSTGNTYIEQNDVIIPGLGGGLALVRTWNSAWPPSQSSFRAGLFGANWRSTYEERIFAGNDGTVKYARSDGSFWSFFLYGSNTVFQVIAPANARATLVYGTSQWILTFQNGEQRTFDEASGNLTSVVDRNGNTTQLTYDAIARLTTVTDPAGRHLNFGYADSSSRLVTSVTSDVGLSLSYSYDSQARLTQITKPDQTTLSFQYDLNSLITAVLDSNGKVLESHTYDSNGRGLTSSQAGGANAVTISYPH